MITKSERTKSLEETEVDPNEDLMTRGVRSGIKGAALAASRLGDVAATGADMAAKYLKKQEPPKQQRTLQDFLGESPKEAREREQEIRRETRGVKTSPGPRDFLSSLNKKADEAEQRVLDQEIRRETRGVKKPLLKKFKSGGTVKSSASKRADGCATKGKTRGRMV
jgi:hypothetical protein